MVGDQMGDAFGRGMGPVRGAERIVDVDVGEGRQRLRQLRVVLRLPGLVAHVLEHQQLTGAELLRGRGDRIADDRRRKCDVDPDELGEPPRRRCERELRLAVLRATEVRDEDHARTTIAQGLDRGQRRTDARVVRDRRPAVGGLLERHVEVDADEHTLAVQILRKVPQRAHRYRSFWIRSTTRQE